MIVESGFLIEAAEYSDGIFAKYVLRRA